MLLDDESSSRTPEDDLEYATPLGKSSAHGVTIPDQSVKIYSDSGGAPHLSGDNSAAKDSDQTYPVHTRANTNIDTPSIGEVPDASTSTPEVSERSHISTAHNGSAAAQDLPFATSLASSSPHSRLRTPRGSGSPAVAPDTAPLANIKALKIEKEVAKLKEIIEDASPEAIHKLLRDDWRAFLYTPLDEEHLTYIVRACIKNSTPNVIERAIRELLLRTEFRPLVFKSALKYVTTEQLFNQLPSPILHETVDKALLFATAPCAHSPTPTGRP